MPAFYGEGGLSESAEDTATYYSLTFRLDDVGYAAGWRISHGSPFPLWLHSEKEFRYLVKPWREKAEPNVPIFCTVLKAWEGKKLVLDNIEGQPVDQPSTQSDDGSGG
jgi:hypothetical protein